MSWVFKNLWFLFSSERLYLNFILAWIDRLSLAILHAFNNTINFASTYSIAHDELVGGDTFPCDVSMERQ